MRLSGLQPYQKLLVGVVVVAFIICGGGGFGIWRVWERNVRLREELEQKREEWEEFKKLTEQLEGTRREFENLLSEVRHLDLGMKGPEYIPTTLEQMRRLTTYCGIKMISFRPARMPPLPEIGGAAAEPPSKAGEEKPAPAPAFQSTPVKLDLVLQGTYRDFWQFLIGLNTFAKLVKINSLNISPIGGEEEARNILSYRISTEMFLLPLMEVKGIGAETEASTGRFGGSYSGAGSGSMVQSRSHSIEGAGAVSTRTPHSRGG